MKPFCRLAFLVLPASLSACSAPPGEAVGASSQPVESAYYEASGGFLVDMQSQANDPVLAATGVLYTPFLNESGVQKKASDGTPLRGTCGVTFISPHYAVTAAHCVTGEDVTSTSTMLTVQQFDISKVAWPLPISAGNGGGSLFPDWSFSQITPAQGYSTTTYNECHVVQRCSSTYGAVIGCDAAHDADVALIRCDDRGWGGASLPVAGTDQGIGNPVAVWWFHEVYSMPTAAPTCGASCPQQTDEYSHYTSYPGMDPSDPSDYDYALNFHYFGDNRNQLLPLYDLPWMIGDLSMPSTRVANDPGGQMTWTDLFGCHGTSGSGVLQWTSNGETISYQLLGPVSQTQSGGLCTDRSIIKQGQESISYTNLVYTQYVAQTAASDHLPILKPIPIRL